MADPAAPGEPYGRPPPAPGEPYGRPPRLPENPVTGSAGPPGKLHFLNPVPIRLIHERWIDKYTEGPAALLAGIKQTLEDGP